MLVDGDGKIGVQKVVVALMRDDVFFDLLQQEAAGLGQGVLLLETVPEVLMDGGGWSALVQAEAEPPRSFEERNSYQDNL